MHHDNDTGISAAQGISHRLLGFQVLVAHESQRVPVVAVQHGLPDFVEVHFHETLLTGGEVFRQTVAQTSVLRGHVVRVSLQFCLVTDLLGVEGQTLEQRDVLDPAVLLQYLVDQVDDMRRLAVVHEQTQLRETLLEQPRRHLLVVQDVQQQLLQDS